MKFKTLKQLATPAILSIAVILQSCGSNTCPMKTFLPNQVVEKYHEACQPSQKTVVYGNPAIYLDYSSGMKVAFADKNTASFYELFINSLKISQADFYEVDKFDINKIANAEKSELYKKIKDAKKFGGINAPLNKAVAQIVNQKQPAVFITDGELWENGERDDPWAREEFEQWLKDGNTIEFFITDHIDQGKQKHLFYIFFVPKSLAEQKSGISSDFSFYLENSIEAKQLKYSHFSFCADATQISKDYNSQSGGVNQNAGLNEDSYILGNNWEYIELYSPWTSLYKYIATATGNDGQPIQGGAPLTSKLYADFSAMEFYKVKNINIKVENITQELSEFITIEEIKANPPVPATNENGKPIVDDNNQIVLVCPGNPIGYDTQGKLIKDTIFKPQTNANECKGIFTLDNDTFNQKIASTNKGEVCIKINKDLNTQLLSSQENNIFRITVYIGNTEVKSSDVNLRNFIWQGKQVSENRSMYNSILGALNAARPEGKTIYTYYINTLPYKN